MAKLAFSSYLAVEGIDYENMNGILHKNSRTRLTDVTDGLSTTLLVGERPPSNNLRYGWLYFGSGQGLARWIIRLGFARSPTRRLVVRQGLITLNQSNWAFPALSCSSGACTMAVGTS
jgi:hypothetical protein